MSRTITAQVALALAWLCLAISAAAQMPQASRLIHSEKSLYRQVLVYEDDADRCLCFTHFCSVGRQSCIDLKSPDRLVFEYTQMMLAALYLNPDPHSVLIIGLGGGTLSKALVKLLPRVEVDAVEIDPAVVQVAAQYFGFRADPHIHVIEQDGRVYVRHMQRESRRYDLIMLDAYDNQYIPEHMLTREFLSEVQSLLSPAGVVAANTFSQSQLYSSESVTYHSVFGEFYNLKSSNRVIIASNGPLPSLETVTRNSHRFSAAFQSLGFSGQSVLERFTTRADWDTHARLLTDQYSPANLLNRVAH